MSLIHGVMLAGKFRTHRELNTMSHDGQRNTLIVELSGRTNQSGKHFQAMDDATLAGTGAVLVFIREGKIRDDKAIKTMSDDDLRNIMIVEMVAQTKLSGPVLQGMTNMDLVLLGLGKAGSFIRGVMLAGKFRTHRELNTMSHDDQRNTLIVELSGRTNQSGAHFQAMDDATLAGTGAILVFIREGKIRDDKAIKTMSDDDLRNIMIVEMGAQTKLSGPVLQGMSNMDLVLLGLGSIPLPIVEKRIIQKYNEINGRNILGLALDQVHSEGGAFVQNFRSGNIKIKPEFLLEIPPTATVTRKVKVFWTGLECRIRQEGEDEVLGTVASFTPSSGASKAHNFPEGQEFFTMGREGSRIINDNVLICESAVGDLLIVCSLVEHDSGDIDKYKEEVAKLLAKAASAFAGMAGADAETLGASQGFISDISLGIVNVASSFLGADDDQYNPGSILIHTGDLLKRFKPNPLDTPDPFPRQFLRRDDDPKTIEFTHSLILSGTDQGGDRGDYGFYFDVQLLSIIEVVGGQK